MEPRFIKTTILLDEVGSTNDYAKALVEASSVELPCLVRAESQTRGRGRGANTWWSDVGSLLFTIAMRPASIGIDLEKEPRVALAAALAVSKSLESHAPRVNFGIRWPNDLLANGRKICGILPERVDTPSGACLVIGIGVNVRTDFEKAPASLRAAASSLVEFAPAIEMETILDAILDRLPREFDALSRNDPDLVLDWNRRDALRGTQVRIDLSGRRVEGRGQGITEQGGLILNTTSGVEIMHGGRLIHDE